MLRKINVTKEIKLVKAKPAQKMVDRAGIAFRECDLNQHTKVKLEKAQEEQAKIIAESKDTERKEREQKEQEAAQKPARCHETSLRASSTRKPSATTWTPAAAAARGRGCCNRTPIRATATRRNRFGSLSAACTLTGAPAAKTPDLP